MNAGLEVSPPVHMARFKTAPGPHGVVPLPPMGNSFVVSGGTASPPPPFMRQISRIPSAAGVSGGAGAASGEWRAGISVEERISIRRRVKEAYLLRCSTYESLLDTATAVEEELLFACSNNRIDYFKAAIDWDARIQIKRQQLTQHLGKAGSAAATVDAANSAAAAAAAPSTAGRKRSADEVGNSLTASSTSLLDSSFSNADLRSVATGAAAAAAAAPASIPLPTVAALLFPAASLPTHLFVKAEPVDEPTAKKQRS